MEFSSQVGQKHKDHMLPLPHSTGMRSFRLAGRALRGRPELPPPTEQGARWGGADMGNWGLGVYKQGGGRQVLGEE